MRIATLLFAAVVCLGSCAHAAVVHDESVDGELSNDKDNPTALTFTIGDNTVIGNVGFSQGTGNFDIFTFNVADGLQWESLTLDSYQSSDNVAFISIDSGTTFPYDSSEFDEVNNGNLPDDAFLGATTFGPGFVGRDILPLVAGGVVAGRGLDLPGAAGDYSVFIQQLGSPTDYQFTLTLTAVAVPEPGSALALGLVSGVVLLRRRRSDRR